MTRRHLLAAILAVALTLGLASACAAPRNTLGTRSSLCFRALPTAKAAVHHRGRLIGVRRVSDTELQRAFPTADVEAKHSYCVVAFSGGYRAQDVDHPAGDPAGRDAVVIVTARGTTVLHTFLVPRVPLRLRH
jgi:hypothetical protein